MKSGQRENANRRNVSSMKEGSSPVFFTDGSHTTGWMTASRRCSITICWMNEKVGKMFATWSCNTLLVTLSFPVDRACRQRGRICPGASGKVGVYSKEQDWHRQPLEGLACEGSGREAYLSGRCGGSGEKEPPDLGRGHRREPVREPGWKADLLKTKIIPSFASQM